MFGGGLLATLTLLAVAASVGVIRRKRWGVVSFVAGSPCTPTYYNLYTELYTLPYTCYNPYVKPESRTPNVRISPHAHELLRQLAEEEQASMQAVLDRAIERYHRESFLRAANSDFQALKGDSRAWKQEVQERQLWEQTLADGLDKK
jgi:hypothetical protein